jgi:MFS family permease
LIRKRIDTVRCASPHTQLLTGIPLGVIQVAASNFIAESSPARLRGPLAATIGMANVVGIILGIATGSQVIHYVKSGRSCAPDVDGLRRGGLRLIGCCCCYSR